MKMALYVTSMSQFQEGEESSPFKLLGLKSEFISTFTITSTFLKL